MSAILVAVIRPPEDGGKLLNGDGPADPLPGLHDVLLGEGVSSQLLLHSLEHAEVY